MSLAEFAGRSFGPNNFVSRMRPKQYKTVPESTLNATLKDVHDLIQYAVVQAQKVIFAEDLEKTFAVGTVDALARSRLTMHRLSQSQLPCTSSSSS